MMERGGRNGSTNGPTATAFLIPIQALPISRLTLRPLVSMDITAEIDHPDGLRSRMISIVVHTLGSEYLDASLVASRRSGDGGEMPKGYVRASLEPRSTPSYPFLTARSS